MSTRPLLHLTAETGWVNDPYGVRFVDGRYHVFFQHVPGSATWAAEQHWGHAVSEDLLRWQELPVALAPDAEDHGIWSGCVVHDAEDPAGATLLYTAVRHPDLHLGRVRAARPVDATWTRWTKGAVVLGPPPDLALTALRDPFVVRDGDRWRMVVGAGLADGTGLALTTTSPDLRSWGPLAELARRHRDEVEPVWTGSVWECPQLIRVADRWVLVVSVWDEEVTRHEAWAVGDLVDGRFEPQRWGRLSHGPAHYAASAFEDAAGRPCLLHWLRGVADPDGGWAGAHSVPHVLDLDGDRLVVRPHPVVDGLRGSGPGDEDATAWDVEVALGPGHGATAAVLLGGGERLDLDAGALRLSTAEGRWSMPAPDGRLRLLLDGPVLEVFGAAGVLGAAVRSTPGRAPQVVGAATSRTWTLA